MKVGDLLRAYELGPIGIVVSPCRRSTPMDNHKLGVMYEDVHPVVEVLFRDTVSVWDIDQLELVSENR